MASDKRFKGIHVTIILKNKGFYTFGLNGQGLKPLNEFVPSAIKWASYLIKIRN